MDASCAMESVTVDRLCIERLENNSVPFRVEQKLVYLLRYGQLRYGAACSQRVNTPLNNHSQLTN